MGLSDVLVILDYPVHLQVKSQTSETSDWFREGGKTEEKRYVLVGT